MGGHHAGISDAHRVEALDGEADCECIACGNGRGTVAIFAPRSLDVYARDDSGLRHLQRTHTIERDGTHQQVGSRHGAGRNSWDQCIRCSPCSSASTHSIGCHCCDAHSIGYHDYCCAHRHYIGNHLSADGSQAAGFGAVLRHLSDAEKICGKHTIL